RYRSAVADRPYVRPIEDFHVFVGANSPSVFRTRNGIENWMRRSAGRPDESLCRNFRPVAQFHTSVSVSEDPCVQSHSAAPSQYRPLTSCRWFGCGYGTNDRPAVSAAVSQLAFSTVVLKISGFASNILGGGNGSIH